MAGFDAIDVALSGINLIEASAGTGKTYNITTLFLRLLLEGGAGEEPGEGLGVDRILVVTFTRAATAELRDRIRKRLRDAVFAFERGHSENDDDVNRLIEKRKREGHDPLVDSRRLLGALRAFDEAPISTIHGFCQRMLQENAFESGTLFDTELITSEDELIEELVQDFWTTEVCSAPPFLYRFLEAHKFKYDKLLALAREVTKHRRAPVLVDIGKDDLESKWAGYIDAWNAVEEIWNSNQVEVRKLLHDALSQGRMLSTWCPDGEDQLGSWLDKIDEIIKGGPYPNLPKRPLGKQSVLPKFAPKGLRKHKKKKFEPPSHPFFDAWGKLFTHDKKVKDAGERRIRKLQCDLVMHVRAELPERKEHANIQSFDDLLHNLNDALDGPDGDALARVIHERFGAALIDEFQDTDPVQYEIFSKVYRGTGKPLFLIGDPKQSIYAFRGADIFSYFRAKMQASGRVHSLDTNRRSDPSLVKAVETLFGRVQDPFIYDEELIGFEKVRAYHERDRVTGDGIGPPLEILFYRRGWDGEAPISKQDARNEMPVRTAAEISRFLHEKPLIEEAAGEGTRKRNLGPGDVAVLVRENRQALQMQKELRKLRIPSVLHSQASVLETGEALEIEQVLKAVAEPGNPGALKAALSTSLFGLGGSELAAIQEEDEKQWESWIQSFQQWHDRWRKVGFIQAFRQMFEKHRVQSTLLGLVDGERRLTNMLHLGELLHVAATTRHLGLNGLLQWYVQVRKETSSRQEVAEDERQIRLESDARAVKLVTIHKSKGLEYPVVYCPYVWDGRVDVPSKNEPAVFHDPGESGDEYELKIDLGPGERKDIRALVMREGCAEGLRLLYVAVTRAMHRCTLMWGGINEAATSPLGYLLFQDQGGGGDLLESTRKRIAKMNDEQMMAGMEQLETESGGSIDVGDLPHDGGITYEPGEGKEVSLEPRKPVPRVSDHWGTSSFSGLVRSPENLSEPAAEGRDHDEEVEDAAAHEADVVEAREGKIVLHDFPRGARAGIFMHSVLENLDFQYENISILEELVEVELERKGYGGGNRKKRVVKAMVSMLDTPLRPLVDGKDPFTLRQVPSSSRLDEIEFLFRVARDGSKSILENEHLASVLEKHARSPVPDGYHERILGLRPVKLKGFLKGFIDMVFVHDGMWYVVDYKSNHLGVHHQDYQERQLVHAMTEHDYFLQYHIYAVALHRYLLGRLDSYDYDEHFGGVFYLFIRGMSPDHPRDCGVFRDRPSQALVESLSRVIDVPGLLEEAS